MDFRGPKKRIDDIDIPRIAAQIGVGEDEIHAVIDVETRGGPSDSKGRLKMLFEPHIFYRELPASKRQRAVEAGLAYKEWRRGQYPKDSYPRLIKAMEIDETAALKACSWGLGQILGDNHKMAGYDTPQEMIADFCLDEENHLDAMVRFIKAAKLDDELRRHDWEGFARGYNGPGYAEHGYHTKLAQRFSWWRGKKDTPYDNRQDAPQDKEINPVPDEDNGLGEVIIKALQQKLWDLGYTNVGLIDGRVGTDTRAAIGSFQEVNGLPVTRTFDPATMRMLGSKNAKRKPISEERSQASKDKVAERIPEYQKQRDIGWWTRVQQILVTVGGVFVGVGDALNGELGKWTSLTTAIPRFTILIVCGIVIFTALRIWRESRDTRDGLAEKFRAREIM